MLDNIFIPTLGRPDNQITYSNLCDKWKAKTILVVQEHEAHLYKDYNILVLPAHIKSLPPTREWIAQQNIGKVYGVFDDDLKFYRTRMKGETFDKSKRKMTDEDFDDLENTICEWLGNDITVCGLSNAVRPPNIVDEYEDIKSVSQLFFFDGRKVPVDDISWNDCTCTEDTHVLLQLIKKGFKSRISNRFRYESAPPAVAGGCSTYRDVSKQNESNLTLFKLHPGLVRLVEKEVKRGGFAGQTAIHVVVQWKKAYKTSMINNLYDSI
jgi:hypothetical protein